MLRRACCEDEAAGDKCADCAGAPAAGLRRAPLETGQVPGPVAGSRVPAIVGQVLSSAGTALQPAVRADLEARLGADFGAVRVHSDAAAARSAAAVGARAYAVGNQIVFGAGRYEPGSDDGRRLLAHELAHVAQQSAADPSGPLEIGAADSDFERDADRRAASAMRPGAGGAAAEPIGRRVAGPMLRRSPDDYQRGFSDGSACKPAQPGPLQPAGLDDYGRGYGAGKEKCAPGPVQAPGAGQCATPFKSAASFSELIDLVRAAETRLAAKGISTPKDQIHALRGIYYGTAWSQDFSVEKSATRNEGFQRFTRPSEDPAKSVPTDVRSILDCHLFEALRDGQDVVDPSGRHVDFGHLIIGLDARNDPAFASEVSYPVALPIGSYNVPLGGTGTELVTWLGDLGGGAANLAKLRASAPATSASAVFSGSDYGGSINLEGDVAASVVATGSTSAMTAPAIPGGKKVSDVLNDYLSPAAPGAAWKDRAATFLKINGAAIDASGALTNRATLVTAFQAKIQTFACNYLASRVKDKHITLSEAKTAGTHVAGTSREVAGVFIDALEASSKSGAKIEGKSFPAPTPPGSQSCTVQLAAGAAGGLLGM